MRAEPQNLDAEQSLIGSLLLSRDAIDEVSHLVNAEDFYDLRNAKIYSLVLDVHSQGQVADAVTIAEAAANRGLLRDIGEMPYLAQVLETVPHASHAERYAEIVAGKARLRGVLSACRVAMEAAYNGDNDAEIIANTEEELHKLLEKSARGQAVGIREALEEVFDRLSSKQPPGVTIDLERLDDLYQFQPGNLVIVGARPGVGKTGLAVHIARSFAEKGRGCLFVSLEMTKLEMASRFISMFAGVSGLKLKRMEPISEEEQNRLMAGASKLGQLPIWIDEDPGTASQIASKCRLFKRRHNIGVVIVDYLQLIEPENKRESREQQVAGLSRVFRRLGKQLNIPVVCLAQLNRKSEDRLDRRPKLSDLRESGAIEADANCVILLHRQEDRPGLVELIVAKNRDGRTGVATVQFDHETVAFRNLAPEYKSGWPDES